MINKKVVKRDGQIVNFDTTKIENAILKAMRYGSGMVDKVLAEVIAKEIESNVWGRISIREIEIIVYNKLVENGHETTAKAYEEYRKIREFKRQENTTDNAVLGLIDRTNEEVMNENSNKNAMMVSTQRDLIAGETSKDITRRKKLPAHIVQAHDDGVLHFHK